MEKDLNKILVTIGIPCYNRAEKLRQTLHMMIPLSRRHPELEILIANDGGDQKSFTNLKSYFENVMNKRGCNFRFLNRTENRGLMGTRIELFQEAKGDYFIPCDDDDFLDIITIDKWLNNHKDINALEDDTDVYLFNMIELWNNTNSAGGRWHDRREYFETPKKNEKTKKCLVNLAGDIINLAKNKHNLPKLIEFDNRNDKHKNIGEDSVGLYMLMGERNQINVVLEPGNLYYANYDMSHEHMSQTDRDKNYIDNLNKYRIYTHLLHEKCNCDIEKIQAFIALDY